MRNGFNNPENIFGLKTYFRNEWGLVNISSVKYNEPSSKGENHDISYNVTDM